MATDTTTNPSVQNLNSWIVNHSPSSSYIHPSLTVRTNPKNNIRGVFTTKTIQKGELLIRYPESLALSGRSLPERYQRNHYRGSSDGKKKIRRILDEEDVEGDDNDEQQQGIISSEERVASPWLRCVVSLMLQRRKQKQCGEQKRRKRKLVTEKEEAEKERGDRRIWNSNHGDDGDEEERKNEESDGVNYETYLTSLPSSYETLFSWSDDEIETFLSGTTLYETLVEDRNHNTTRARFDDSVLPYFDTILKIDRGLQEESNGMTNNELYKEFLYCTQCVSTRGFHITPDDDEGEEDKKNGSKESIPSSSYNGPYLLPYIDLLNHTSLPQLQCTTLRRLRSCCKTSITTSKVCNSSSFDFVMMAERDIEPTEEILHSYGNDLNSSQMLRTFGFVEEHLLRVAAETNNADSCQKNSSMTAEKIHIHPKTPAILSKSDIQRVCEQVATSSYPDQVREEIIARNLEDEAWELPTAAHECPLGLEISDSIVVDGSIINTATRCELDGHTASFRVKMIPNELITLCCLRFLPQEVYDEWSSTASTTLLESDLLDDFYLGKLVLKTVLTVLESKLKKYDNKKKIGYFDALGIRLEKDGESDEGSHGGDLGLLSKLFLFHGAIQGDGCDEILKNSSRKEGNEETIAHHKKQQEKEQELASIQRCSDSQIQQVVLRAMYGLAIQLEERCNLFMMKKDILRYVDYLDSG